MTSTKLVKIADQKLTVKDHTILSGVPDNVTFTSSATSGPVNGIFIGAQFQESNSRHVVSLGTLRDLRFLACFQFRLWWMSQKIGDKGRDIPLETQFLLIESTDHLSTLYTVFLPIIEGPFRACLQGNTLTDDLELCLESGDAHTTASSFTHSLFISAGHDPFAAISDAFKSVQLHLRSFRLRHEKKLPGILDLFGWCTWDAFYQDVTPEGIEAGLKSLAAGSSPPKFLIIDDGWQSVDADPHLLQNNSIENKDLQLVLRLTAVKENQKFKNKEAGIETIVGAAKEKYKVKYVYTWHAITGYWGGVRPGTDDYMVSIQRPRIPRGVMENEPSWENDVRVEHGIGLVSPASVGKFYRDLHGYLACAGVDGVKVDVQSVLQTLGEGHGGRVRLTRLYHESLDASVAINFPDNGIIACMSHNTESFYCAREAGVVRASDDFFPRDPVSHSIHLVTVAYNSVFIGELMVPDWDMFHSLHPAAEYHASARAISGGPLYVSDEPGKHDFKLLRKVVLPDGSILRAKLPGRPTLDCLFSDPSRDNLTLLKIWNMNKFTGVIGVYNCQGAAWSPTEKKTISHQAPTQPLTTSVKSADAHLIDWNGDCALYSHRGSELTVLNKNGALSVSLDVLEYEVFTVSPVKEVVGGMVVRFAPLGLIDMFNGGGAIEGLRYEVGFALMEVKGCGRFGAYASARPRECRVDGVGVDFGFEALSGLLTFDLDGLPKEGEFHVVEIEF